MKVPSIGSTCGATNSIIKSVKTTYDVKPAFFETVTDTISLKNGKNVEIKTDYYHGKKYKKTYALKTGFGFSEKSKTNYFDDKGHKLKTLA